MEKDYLFRIKTYLRHKLEALPHGGFGIHSPYVFNFVTHVLDERLPYYAYSEIEKLRRNLLSDKNEIQVSDYGSKASRKRRICDIASTSCKKADDAQLLFRIAIWQHAKNILELGTCLGLTTAYLAKSDSRAKVVSMEGCPQTAHVAKKNLEILGVRNAEIIVGNIDESLDRALDMFESLDLVFIDANHTKQATMSYFEACLKKAAAKSIIVIDDIYYSRGMHEAWVKIKNNPNVNASIDIYTMGIIIIDNEVQKGSYRIK